MSENKASVVILCGSGMSSRIMYHGIASHADIIQVIVEKKIASKQLLKRRVLKLGGIKVAGQIAFTLYNEILTRLSSKRTKELIETLHLNHQNPPNELITRVSTANSDVVIALLQELNPDAVVVNGTRILSKKILDSIDKPFINTHVGITPKYRGVHGGYWALAKSDADNCGVTVHLVDPGIDTGGVLYQDTIEINSKDNFSTYPILQLAKALPLMRKALDDVARNDLKPQPGVLPSQLFYHPTLFEYLKNRILKGVK
jgi:folate-dependent phosphoribosylglycinamide formyltransferase PurN